MSFSVYAFQSGNIKQTFIYNLNVHNSVIILVEVHKNVFTYLKTPTKNVFSKKYVKKETHFSKVQVFSILLLLSQCKIKFLLTFKTTNNTAIWCIQIKIYLK